MLELASGKAVS